MSQKITTSVPLPNIDLLPDTVREYLQSLPPLNVYRMVATLPTGLQPFIELAKSFLKDAGVPSRLLEISILRVAHLTKSPYEEHQHRLIAQTIGITDAETQSIFNEKPVTHLNEAENFICKVADELTLDVNLSNDTFQKLYADYSIHQATAIIMCISFYNMLSRFLNATRVPIEETNPLAGKKSPLN